MDEKKTARGSGCEKISDTISQYKTIEKTNNMAAHNKINFPISRPDIYRHVTEHFLFKSFQLTNYS